MSESAQQRYPLAKLASLAERVMDELRPHCARIEVAGSIRRESATVADIDLVCIPRPGRSGDLDLAFRRCAEDRQLALDGRMAKRCQLRKSKIQCDLWIAHLGVPDLLAPLPSNWGAMMMTYTGSRLHNIRVVERAKELGMTYRPGHGLITEEGRVISEMEELIYEALGWEFIPPAKRE